MLEEGKKNSCVFVFSKQWVEGGIDMINVIIGICKPVVTSLSKHKALMVPSLENYFSNGMKRESEGIQRVALDVLDSYT